MNVSCYLCILVGNMREVKRGYFFCVFVVKVGVVKGVVDLILKGRFFKYIELRIIIEII